MVRYVQHFIYQHKDVKKKYIIFNFYGPFVQLFFASVSFNMLCVQFHRHSHNGNLHVLPIPFMLTYLFRINSLNIDFTNKTNSCDSNIISVFV